MLEANLVFYKGLTIPLMSEFLSYAEGDPDNHKQDCELKAFKRLAERLKKEFPPLPVMVLLDGLYPNGLLMELCRNYRWQYMIVLHRTNVCPCCGKKSKRFVLCRTATSVCLYGGDAVSISCGSMTLTTAIAGNLNEPPYFK